MVVFAVIEIGGKQYRVTEGDQFEAERIEPRKDGKFIANKVLLISEGKKVDIGRPHVKGASVVCQVLRQYRAKKVVAFKYRRRKSSRTTIGHRQNMSRLEVKEIKSG